ncbi:MAG: tRNA-(guanine-N1)-methyltransferase [Acidobacteria bacterium]|nr:MAG: tRNA-(guanine-N1)-methyltransferase [Acidobacteriota bacterium]
MAGNYQELQAKMTWFKAATLDQLKERKKALVCIQGLDILIVYDSGTVYALENICSHEDASLFEGCIEGDDILCPLHSWRFNYKTGSCLTGDDFDLPVYKTKIVNNTIWVDVEE